MIWYATVEWCVIADNLTVKWCVCAAVYLINIVNFLIIKIVNNTSWIC